MLVQNEYFSLLVEGNEVILRSKQAGFLLKDFDQITREFPRIKIDSFRTLTKALSEVGADHKIGKYLPPIEVEVSLEKMKAEVHVNVTKEQFEAQKQELLVDVDSILQEKGIVHGRIPTEEIQFQPGIPIVIARGTEPETGHDASIQYIEIPERKPVIREDGSADYYEMNFVTPIDLGQWLGEKVPAGEGIDGMDVYGNILTAKKGLDLKLQYDRKSVEEVQEDDKIVLRAIHGGALEFNDGIVGVGKQLVISSDVGPETGSITFDGAVRIIGTVLAGYSVNATGDISIEANEGVTNAKEIRSTEGDIYIKGGIFGGGETIVAADNALFIKHANNCKLYAKEIHVGLYVLGSELIGEYIYVDKNRGKIIGGHTEALYYIECASAGNQLERNTLLHAKGVNKDDIYVEVQEMAQELKDLQESIQKMQETAQKFDIPGIQLPPAQIDALEKIKRSIYSGQQSILELDRSIQKKLVVIKDIIAPKIHITKEAFPGVTIKINQKSSTLQTSTKGMFEIIDGVLNV